MGLIDLSLPSLPFDFLQICPSELSKGLDVGDDLLLDEWTNEFKTNGPNTVKPDENFSPDEGFLIDPQERASAMGREGPLAHG